MRKRDRKELGRYVRWIANAIGLRDWTIRIDIGTVNEPHLKAEGHEWGATCEPIPGRKYAALTFAPYQRHASREELRQTVVHELVHCHFFGVWDTCRRDALEAMSQPSYDVWIAGVERQMEYGVDAVADALAPHMPLIDWPKEKP